MALLPIMRKRPERPGGNMMVPGPFSFTSPQDDGKEEETTNSNGLLIDEHMAPRNFIPILYIPSPASRERVKFATRIR